MVKRNRKNDAVGENVTLASAATATTTEVVPSFSPNASLHDTLEGLTMEAEQAEAVAAKLQQSYPRSSPLPSVSVPTPTLTEIKSRVAGIDPIELKGLVERVEKISARTDFMIQISQMLTGLSTENDAEILVEKLFRFHDFLQTGMVLLPVSLACVRLIVNLYDFVANTHFKITHDAFQKFSFQNLPTTINRDDLLRNTEKTLTFLDKFCQSHEIPAEFKPLQYNGKTYNFDRKLMVWNECCPLTTTSTKTRTIATPVRPRRSARLASKAQQKKDT